MMRKLMLVGMLRAWRVLWPVLMGVLLISWLLGPPFWGKVGVSGLVEGRWLSGALDSIAGR